MVVDLNYLNLMRNILITFIFLFFLTQNIQAEQRDDELNSLFEKLKISNQSEVKEIENKIWKIWTTHPSTDRRGYRLTELLAQGDFLMTQRKFDRAYEIFSVIISTDPSWAEAWNKRATVLYLLGQYEASQDDIDIVLKLEKRHFGALSGQARIFIKLQEYEKAIKSIENALKFYPSFKSRELIPEIERLIREDSI